jgi:hypothetical protein
MCFITSYRQQPTLSSVIAPEVSNVVPQGQVLIGTSWLPLVPLYVIGATLKTAGRSADWLAHLPWEQGVGGSNPLAPTNQ